MSGHKVGFFTGTFNPVHSRHAEIVKGLIDKGLVDAVVIIPNDMTYHKANVLDISDRIQMLNYQFEDEEHIYVPDSVAFGGSSFIPMELRMRAYLHKLNPTIQYFGIIGADCVDSRSVKVTVHASNFFSSIKDHISYWLISTSTHPKYLEQRSEFFGMGGEYVYIPTENEIHSTKIRDYFENPIKHPNYKDLVIKSIHPKVIDYISEKQLYEKRVDKPSKLKKMLSTGQSYALLGIVCVGLHAIDLSRLHD